MDAADDTPSSDAADSGAMDVVDDVRRRDGGTRDAMRRDGGTGGVGAMCGGVAMILCGSGETCVLNNPSQADSAGHCHTVNQAGGSCGGATLYPPVCASGLQCVLPDVIIPGGHGTCEPM
jgi:hypothetical protein